MAAALPVHPHSPLYDREAAERLSYHPEELAAQVEGLRERDRAVVFLVNSENTAKASTAQRIAYQLEAAGLRLDEQRQCVCLNGADVDLTAAEFRLLRYFMLHPGQVLSKGHLAEHLYDGETERDSNVIEVHVNHLRRKLGREVIETRRGQGYRYAGVAAG